MTQLRIYSKDEPEKLQMTTSLPLEISELLGDTGISYKHIDITSSASKIISDADVYAEVKAKMMKECQNKRLRFCSIASISESFPSYERLRLRFLSEHFLEEDEGYLILEGRCLLSFHLESKVIQLFCDKGDFITIPANVKHWIDMGTKAQFTTLKCSEQEEAAVIYYTGSYIADEFPRFTS